MKEKYRQLHRDMLGEIDYCQQWHSSENEIVETCYRTVLNYYDKLKKLVMDEDFEDEAEEIDFFRNVKPAFTCYIEYFVLLSEALFFVHEVDCATKFWSEEKKRFIRFCEEHDFFVKYYEAGRQDSDVNFFLRENNDFRFVTIAHYYDRDPVFCTSHDQLVRSYLANKKYYEYCNKKIDALIKVRS